MELALAKKRVAQLELRLQHKAYKVKDYFDLSNAYRQKLLDDLEHVSSLHHALDLHSNKDWAKGKNLEHDFILHWLSYYVLDKYIAAIGTNSVIDTFLNDPLNRKKGVLADFREHLFDPKKASYFINVFNKVKSDSATKKIVKKYPLDVESFIVNARKLLKYRLFHFYLPAQVKISEWLSTHYRFASRELFVQNQHLDDLFPYLEIGDVLLQRTNYRLTNITLPGFWTHVMIYVGNNEVIEATPGKVRRIDWKKTASSDYLAVLRPNCSKEEKRVAVMYAHDQIGKKYDFDFDFLSDEGFVCSELILKAYPYLKPKLTNFFGHLAYSPSKFIELFNKKKFAFVYFLDSTEKNKRVQLGTAKELSTSHLRSKWEVFQK